MLGAADAVKAVAAGDDVALEHLVPALVPEADGRALAREVVHAHVLDLEQERRAARDPRRDQVLDDLGLAVDDDAAALREIAQRDAVAPARELQLDAVVDEALALHALAHARSRQQVDRALLEHPGADALLDVLAAARLEHDRVDALELQQAGEHETGRAGADDADLCPHQSASAARTAPPGPGRRRRTGSRGRSGRRGGAARARARRRAVRRSCPAGDRARSRRR